MSDPQIAYALQMARLLALRAAYLKSAARDKRVMVVVRRLSDEITCLQACEGHSATD